MWPSSTRWLREGSVSRTDLIRQHRHLPRESCKSSHEGGIVNTAWPLTPGTAT
jgi:hypothetical protein